MSGHSKWSNIKHKKKINDVKKSKLFSKLASDIKTIVKQSKSDLNDNSKLKKVVDKALSKNMGKNVINNIINNSNDIIFSDKIFYAATGLSGLVFIIECFNSNKNRIVGELRHFFSKNAFELVALKNVEYLYIKLDKINIISFFNDKIIFTYLSKITSLNVLDTNLYLDTFDSKLFYLFSNLIDNKCESNNFFSAKNKIFLDEKIIFNLNKIIDDLIKIDFVSNIYYNF